MLKSRSMNKTIVQYNSDLNKISFKDFNEKDLSLFFAICSRIRDKGSEIVVLEFEQLKRITNETNHISAYTYAKTLDGLAAKLASLNFGYITDTKFIRESAFPKFEADFENKTLTVQVSQTFTYLFNELSKEFTLFELDEFLNAKGKYSKLLYRLLKQFKTTGKYYVFMDSTEERPGFRELMNIPEGYKTKDITRRILDTSVEELRKLKSFKDLRYDYVKKGRKVNKVIFTWVPEERYVINDFYKKPKKVISAPDYIKAQKNGIYKEGDKISYEEAKNIKNKVKKHQPTKEKGDTGFEPWK